PRPSTHTTTNGRIVTPVTADQSTSPRSCYELYAPDLNPVEGIWSLLRRGWLSNVAFSTPEHLVHRIRRGLRHIQYRSDLIDGCLAETGLTIRPA
ncbi:hypothetical protein ACGF22_07035, partial [Streptomyces wuyuanensis]